jgi:toxin ParE1/3/4
VAKEGGQVKIDWSERANRNRREQLTYIASENPTAALRLSKAIRLQVRQLAKHPELGRKGRMLGRGNW